MIGECSKARLRASLTRYGAKTGLGRKQSNVYSPAAAFSRSRNAITPLRIAARSPTEQADAARIACGTTRGNVDVRLTVVRAFLVSPVRIAGRAKCLAAASGAQGLAASYLHGRVGDA